MKTLAVPFRFVTSLAFLVVVAVARTSHAPDALQQSSLSTLGAVLSGDAISRQGSPWNVVILQSAETPGAVPWTAAPATTGDGTLRINLFAGAEVKWCARIDATEVTR